MHRLDKLWDLCKDILVKAGLEGPQEDLETVDEYIRQFHNVDPKGEAFRYGAELPGIKRINLRNLKDVMDRLEGFFNGLSTQVSEYLSNKQDYESYY